MACVPTKQMTALYEKAANNRNQRIKSGNYELCVGTDAISLYHYGTLIFRWNNTDNSVDLGGSRSASDRDAINGLLTLMGFPRCAYIRRGVVHFDHRWFNEYLEDQTL